MKKSISLVYLLLTAILSVSAQVSLAPSVVASGGGYAETENLSISWTLGEVAVSTLTGGNMILTQGFQQPFDTVDIGNSMEEDEMAWGISVYPNPVGDELRIRFDIENPGNFLVEVQDVTGRILCQKLNNEVNPGDIILLNTSSYTNGLYFLKISTADRREVQVTSIRKL